ncbi:phage tail tape measure protein [Klebsiella variicola subsp. variicola]|uniref:phage tail tape measure protein n=1 Tax=Klebsiella variicola TaxID=244366 RepID=UPI000B3D37E7|nr:phage tail tape measure protein [Klebsiella variicola]AWA01517.1 phage tail tape measure protein [Klebsiella variicola]MDW0343989.1 phage tail tape measure protein [Klebsiella variicola]
MANRLTTEILINLAGNLTAKARQYGANMSEFARTNQRAMSVVKATTAAAGRGLDALGNRYTTMIAGFAGGALLRNYQQLDRRLTRMGITAGKTRKEIADIFDTSQNVAIKFGVDTSEIQGAFEEINGRSGDLNLALKNTDNIGMAIAASGADGATLGGLIAEYKKLQIEDKKQTLLALDGMNRLGKEGAFELKDAAEKLPASLSMYAAVGGKGVKGAMDVMTVAESAMDVTANKDKAATAVENFIRDLQNPKVVKTLQKNGINVFDSNGAMRPLPELLQETAARSSKGGIKKQRGRLTEAGFNQDSMDLIAGVTGEAGAKKLKTYMGVIADGQSIIEDAAYASQDFTSAMQRLATTLEKFANKNLAKPIQELADVINNLDPKVVQEWLEFGKNVAISIGGIIAARKAFKFGKDIWDMFSPSKGKGIPGDVADVFGSGVMPVYVTNWPADGVGGKGEDKVDDLLDASSDLPGWPGMLARGGLIISKLMGLTGMDPFSDEGRDELLKRVQQNNERSTMWDDLKNWLISSSQPPAGYQDPSPWASMQPQNQSGYPFLPQQLQGEVKVIVEDNRVRVSSVKVNAPGVTMSAQSGVSNVEQD